MINQKKKKVNWFNVYSFKRKFVFELSIYRLPSNNIPEHIALAGISILWRYLNATAIL